MSSGKIPRTDSIEELAQFWDTHDLTDFENELEEVTEPVFERRTVVKVHLQPKPPDFPVVTRGGGARDGPVQ